MEISLWHMNSHSSPDAACFDTKKFFEKLLTLDVDENLLLDAEERDDRLAGRMVGAGFDTFDDMISQVRACAYLTACFPAVLLLWSCGSLLLTGWLDKGFLVGLPLGYLPDA